MEKTKKEKNRITSEDIFYALESTHTASDEKVMKIIKTYLSQIEASENPVKRRAIFMRHLAIALIDFTSFDKNKRKSLCQECLKSFGKELAEQLISIPSDKDGNTSLHRMVIKRNKVIAKLLLDHDQDGKLAVAQNNNGNNALHLAVQPLSDKGTGWDTVRDTEMIKLLLAYDRNGTITDARNNQRKTPLEEAFEFKERDFTFGGDPLRASKIFLESEGQALVDHKTWKNIKSDGFDIINLESLWKESINPKGSQKEIKKGQNIRRAISLFAIASKGEGLTYASKALREHSRAGRL